MASSAWTANREELVRELANARAERDTALAKLQAAHAREAARKATNRERVARQRARDRTLDQVRAIAKADATPPDPNAALHRRTLIAALKEKP